MHEKKKKKKCMFYVFSEKFDHVVVESPKGEPEVW